MKITPPKSLLVSVLLAGAVSACSPNPYVLQDRVYGSMPAPQVKPEPVQQKPKVSVPVARTLPLPEEKAPKVESLGSAPPDIAEEPAPDVEVLVVKPGKQYQSSSAVQALMKQADTETANGKLDDAVATIERALRMESDNPNLWLKLAKLNEQQGNREQAVSMLGKAKYYQELLD